VAVHNFFSPTNARSRDTATCCASQRDNRRSQLGLFCPQVTATIRSSTIACRTFGTGATTAPYAEHDCNLRLRHSREFVRDVGRELIVAWFRPMGADEVAYHQATVVGRVDDHPGAALDYYGSRGETLLRWGGVGAARLGLAGEVTAEGYEAAFGIGGFVIP
jgi:hypothetical protein